MLGDRHSPRGSIVILGSTGMAGHMVFDYLSSLGRDDIVGISRTAGSRFVQACVDVEDTGLLFSTLQMMRPSVVVNCIGVLNTNVDANLRRAILLNSYLPHLLASWGTDMGYKLIHLSTDCVFSGNTGGYTEASEPDGISMYARTKILGEVRTDRHLTFRTSIIGPELRPDGNGLMSWFMQQSGTVAGYAGVLWTGVTTLELAKAIAAAIDQDLGGLYHLVPGEAISKYALLVAMAQAFGRHDVTVAPTWEPRLQRTLVCTRKDFRYTIPSYKKMLDELVQVMKGRPEKKSEGGGA